MAASLPSRKTASASPAPARCWQSIQAGFFTTRMEWYAIYSALLIWLVGQTPGMLILGLRVVQRISVRPGLCNASGGTSSSGCFGRSFCCSSVFESVRARQAFEDAAHQNRTRAGAGEPSGVIASIASDSVRSALLMRLSPLVSAIALSIPESRPDHSIARARRGRLRATRAVRALTPQQPQARRAVRR